MTGMLKTVDVVCAILERDGKILLAQRPLHADQPGLWEFAGGKVEAGETQPEVSRRLINLHAWHVPEFTGTPETHYHSQLVWCSVHEALGYDLAPADIPLLEAFILLRDARPADWC